ncbi:MAG: DUF1641 domain-containing protein [Sandaracinaceae bacterium]
MPDAAPNGHAPSAPPADPLLARLDAIERRLARIEPALDALGDAPGLASMAVDVVDEQAGRLRDRGVDPEARLMRLLELTERLTADDTMAAIEGALTLASDAPGLASMAVDIVDERAGALRDRGVDVQARLGRAAALLERLTDDKTMDGLEAALAFADELPGLASMAVDIVDEQAGALRDEGIDPALALANGARTALQFASLVGPREIHALQTLLASEALAPEAVAVVSAAAQSLVECQGHERGRTGPVGLFKALRDPDVQRALDFLIGVARRFGAALEAGPPSAAVVQSQAATVGPRSR